MTTKVIPIRWNKKNLAYFKALNYIDNRNGVVKVGQNPISLNKLINKLVSLAFDTGDYPNPMNPEKLLKKYKAVLIKSLNKEQEELENKIQEISKW
jgi:hypothetical protein